jgi:hypothetical protein
MPVVWQEREHPRDSLGRFRRKLKFGLGGSATYSNFSDDEAKAAFEPWASELSTEIDFDKKDFGERATLENYTQTAHFSEGVNTFMRKGTIDEGLHDPQEIKVAARRMSDSIGRSEVPENTVTYRFFEDEELLNLARQGNIVGTKITDDGFMSTSLGTDLMREAGFTGEPMDANDAGDVQSGDVQNATGSIIATIRVPEGARAAYMNASGISDEEAQAGFFRKGGISFYPNEQELVLGDGTTAEITAARFDPDSGALLVTMDVVEQLGPSGSGDDEQESAAADEGVGGEGEAGFGPDLPPTAPMPEHTPEATAKLDEFETANRFEPTEHGMVLTPHGEVLFEAGGDEEKIAWPAAVRVYDMPDNILTHNHPQDLPLSQEDIQMMAATRLGEIRVVSPEHKYSMTWAGFPDSAADRKLAEALPPILEEEQAAYKEAFDAGEVDAAQGTRRLWHNVWTRVAPEIGMVYSHEELQPADTQESAAADEGEGVGGEGEATGLASELPAEQVELFRSVTDQEMPDDPMQARQMLEEVDWEDPRFENIEYEPLEAIDDSLIAAAERRAPPSAIESAGLDPNMVAGRFANAGRAYDWAWEVNGSHVRNLPDDQRKALVHYKRGGYGPINNRLRRTQGDLDALEQLPTDRATPQGIREDIEALDAAFESAPPTDEPVLLYRYGLPPEIMQAYQDRNEHGLLGQTFGDDGFTSTTINPDWQSQAVGLGAMARMVLPAGSKMLPTEGITQLKGAPEYEVMLPRGVRYRVTGVSRDERDRPEIEVEILGPEGQGDTGESPREVRVAGAG